MRAIISGLVAVGVALVLAPAVARAGTITQDFTITISPAANLDVSHGSADAVFPASPLAAQFNPALGTLTSVSMSITGAVTYTLSGPGSNSASKITQISARIANSFDRFDEQDQNQTGTINLDLAGAFPNVLTPFIGTGSVIPVLALHVAPFCEGACTATFGTNSPLSGTLIYTFTPAAALVPEPASLTVLAMGLAGLGMVLRTRRA